MDKEKITIDKPIDEIRVGTKILDDGKIKTISRLFTVSQLNIENESQSKGEQVYVEFEGYGGDMNINYIRQNCKIVE